MMMISYEYGNVGLSVASRKVKCKFRPWLEDSEDGAGYRNLSTGSRRIYIMMLTPGASWGGGGGRDQVRGTCDGSQMSDGPSRD